MIIIVVPGRNNDRDSGKTRDYDVDDRHCHSSPKYSGSSRRRHQSKHNHSKRSSSDRDKNYNHDRKYNP